MPKREEPILIPLSGGFNEVTFNETLRKQVSELLYGLGVFVFRPKDVKIVEPILGIERPLADLASPEIKEPRARDALRRLQSIPEE